MTPFDRSGGLLRPDHLEDVLQGERLEVEPARGVVVGGDRLRVAVDHDGLVAGLGEREGRVHAGVVELDALTDPVRPAAQDDHLGFLAPGDLGLVVVGGVQVRGAGRELRGAGVDRVVHGPHAEPPADLPDHGLRGAAELGDLRVGEAVLLGRAQGLRVEGRRVPDLLGDLVDVLDLLDEPGIDAGGAATSARLAPARSARWMVSRRPSWGVAQARSRRSASAGGSSLKPNGPWLLSSDLRAFCSASGKLRPMAMASPTLFMWVVSVVSAPGNFSNANRGTLTTT